MGGRIKKQIRWRAAIWLGCVCIKSKSHGTYGRKSSFLCVMSVTFTYYSGSFVSLRQNSTTLAKFRLCLNDVYLKHSPQRKSCGVHWVNANSDELHFVSDLRFFN